MIDVSVVIPAYNEDLEVLNRAERSAYKANADQLITVFDGPQMEPDRLVVLDEDGEVESGVEHERLPINWYETLTTTVIASMHAGICHARNLGIRMAWNDLIVPLDADDELLPDGLQKLVDAWEPGTLVYGNWLEALPTGPDGNSFEELKIAPPPAMLSRKHVAHATWLFHKDDWRRVGGFDPDFNIGGEDWAFMVALVAAGVKAVRINAPIFKRTVRSGSRTDQARGRIDFIRQLLREKYPKVMNAG